ncbi:MAG: hypothetical protein LBN42_04995, partial [Oscillospiraceae bacterium]|nr:hypothetical protein [Oscillospiraceae bacterium]
SERLNAVFAETDTDITLPKGTQADLATFAKQIASAADSIDVFTLQKVLNETKSYRWNTDAATILAKIETSAEQFDYTALGIAAQELRELC